MQSWGFRVQKAIERERAEAEKKYNITIELTTIRCNRCGRRIACPVNHVCMDIARKEQAEDAKLDMVQEPAKVGRKRRGRVRKPIANMGKKS